MNPDRKLELKVGVFVLIGLAIIAAMALHFGRVGQGFADFYPLTVNFPNANGLLKGSDVQLAGARIGYVEAKPVITANVSSVSVTVRIRDDVRIPREANFQVGSSGLLGDRFVEVLVPEEFDPLTFNPEDESQVWREGEVIEGTRAGGIDALAARGEETLAILGARLEELEALTKALHEGVLSEKNLKNLEATFENLKAMSDSLVLASDNVNEFLEVAQQTASTANSAAGDLRATLDDARKVIDSAQTVVQDISTGPGVLATLISNRDLSDNLKALIANLRRHGVLWYRDSAAREQEAQPRAPRRR